ncbi:YdcF family protein [Marimonas sp. MJW-29]|uniref:YdcF family protein n=1 Tax=Sulfitobacter sediminis TaxID=3234186 RepID=A0ABV3RMW2_9RHOB
MLLFDFMSRTADTGQLEGVDDLPRTAVVFTGAYDRIDLGLELLASNRLDHLLITGANRTSGLIPTRFPQLFDPSSQQTRQIESRHIVLAPDAHSTIENALETACWLDTKPDTDAVALITSRRHMARASVALQHAIGPVDIVRVISDQSKVYDKSQLDLDEFTKFVGTWIITLLPRSLWPASELTICSED